MKLRILCYYPGPANCNPDSPHWSWPVRELGADIRYYRDCPQRIDDLCHGCDVVAYMAVLGGPHLPPVEAFDRARQLCRLVAVVGDGGCPYARGLLEEYKQCNTFDMIVNIDGNPDWPHRDVDMTYFGMFDPKTYDKVLPRERRLGYNGAGGVVRGAMVDSLGTDIAAQVGYFPEVWTPYQHYADWMLGTRAIVNTAWSSHALTFTGKGRVNEAALAGCLLFETGGSFTRNWFKPARCTNAAQHKDDVDAEYLEYTDFAAPTLSELPPDVTGGRDAIVARTMPKVAEEIRAVLRRSDFDEYAEAMGARMKARVLRDYGPSKFWSKVCAA